MTKDQFTKALAVARSAEDLDGINDEHLHGCGLPEFERATTTVRAVAKLLRWQVIQFNGELDERELGNMREIARRKFDVIDII
jgi:hypothetical protein